MTAPATSLEVLTRAASDYEPLTLPADVLDAIRVTRRLVEAALAYPCRFCGAVSSWDCQRDCPQRRYRAWAPGADDGTGDGGRE